MPTVPTSLIHPSKRSLTLSAPVFYNRKSAGRIESRFGLTEIEIPIGRLEDTSLAARWPGDRDDNTPSEYRAHQGRILYRAEDVRHDSPQLARLSIGHPDPSAWRRLFRKENRGFRQDGAPNEFSWINVYDHPLRDRRPLGGAGGEIFQIVKDDAPGESSGEDYDARVAVMRANAAECLIIDGDVWAPAPGPFLDLGRFRLGAAQDREYWQRPWAAKSVHSRGNLFHGRDAAAAFAAFNRIHGMNQQVPPGPDIIDPDAFRAPLASITAIDDAFSVAMQSKRLRMADVTPAFIDKALELRLAFENGFPERAFNWQAPSYEPQWAPNLDAIKAPVDAAPFASLAHDLLGMWPFKVARWGFDVLEFKAELAAEEHARLTAGPAIKSDAPEDDLEAIAGLRV